MNYSIDSNGYYGEFGGAYIPEILHRCVSQLQEACRTILPSDDFKREFEDLLRHYVGRPSPLYHARRLSEKYGCKVYLKREDLNHTGAHKINNAVGQMLLARRAVWANDASLLKQVPDNTVWQPLPYVPWPAWSVWFSWERPTSNASMSMWRK